MLKKINLKFIFTLALAFLFTACAGGNKNLKCNLHVIELMAARKIYLPNTTANGLDRYLKSSDNWQQIPKTNKGKLNHKAAYKAARSGKAVIASYNGGNKNGHVVMVYGKRKMKWSKSYKDNVPYVSGSVNGKKAKVSLLSEQFSPAKQPRMNYFIYHL